MDFIFFLLKNSPFLSGEAWDMPHSLWYNDSSGFILGIILTLIISLATCIIYYHVFSRIFRNIPLTRLNWLLFLIINAAAVFFITFFVAKSGITDYAMANGYIDDAPSILGTLEKGTYDMWMFATQNALYSVIAYFILSFICRIKSRGFNIPF